MKISPNFSLLVLFITSTSFAVSHPVGKSGPIVEREGFTLQYNSECKVSHWVSYSMNVADLIKNVSRTNNFRKDPEIKTAQAGLEDYKHSGYDRGHMARAGLFTKSKQLMSDTFVLSNMVPQNPYMNQNGAWSKVEVFEYNSIKAYEQVEIVSGPVLGPNMQRIGPNEVCVPNEVYKVMYKTSPKPSAIAFIIPNYRTSLSFKEYAVTIDELEEKTGLDFFPELDNEIEKEVESQYDFNDWSDSFTQI